MSDYMNIKKSPQVFVAVPPVTLQAASKSVIQSYPSLVTAVTGKPTAACMPTYEEIARHAHHIYIGKGMPQGQSEQIWLQAEEELLSHG